MGRFSVRAINHQSVAVSFLGLEPRLRKRLERKLGAGFIFLFLTELPQDSELPKISQYQRRLRTFASIQTMGVCEPEDLDSPAPPCNTSPENPMIP